MFYQRILDRPYLKIALTSSKKTQSIIETILDRWRRGPRGPLPQLNRLQVLTALLLIMQQGPLGRRALSEQLEIKDGIVRGLLERLAEQNIIRVRENGVELTLTGKNKLQSFLDKLSIKKIIALETSDLAPGPSAVAAHVKRAYRSGMTGVQQRDEAIKAGADGAITIIAKNRELRIPPDNAKISDLAPAENKRLGQLLNLSDDDLVIIGFGQNPWRALAGAMAAVLSLEDSEEEGS